MTQVVGFNPMLKSPPIYGHQKSKAFTLIELLVVVSIIAILAALLLPTAKKMIDNSNTAKCASNERQIMIGMLKWTKDNENTLPNYNSTPTNGSAGYYWYAELSRDSNSAGGTTLPYCGHNPLRAGESANTVFICPANSPFNSPGSKAEISYGLNGASGTNGVFPNRPYDPPLRIPSLSQPSKTVAFCEWNLQGKNLALITSDSDIAAPHNGGCNVAFIDGHVEFMKPKPAYTNAIFSISGGN